MIGQLQSDSASMLEGKVKAAIESDNQWWQQRVLDTTQDDGFKAPVFRSGDSTEPYRGVEGTVIKTVCHNGVPATQRFNAGPAVEI